MRDYILYVIILVLFIVSLNTDAQAERFTDNIVTITVTRQGYNYNMPWQKLSVEKEKISGIVIEGNRILTISYKLADHVLLEASKFGSSRKYPAELLLKDYQCGLALIKVPDDNFFNDLKPVQFNTDGSIKKGKALVVRWDNNGIFKEHPAEYLKSAIEIFESSGIVLMHQMISDIDSAGKGEPVFMNGRLAGIASWHLSKKKIIKVIDLKVIERMFKDFDAGNYKGMPFFNIEDAALENDENLREYLGLGNKDTGVLVIDVPSNTSGSNALKEGDVILNINGTDIDDNGLYQSAQYGKLNYYGLIYLDHFVGDPVRMNIVRNKRRMDIDFVLKPFSDDSFLIPAASYDAPPKYYIIGGLVFQELNREYLKTWGRDWAEKADKRLMYYYDNFAKHSGPGHGRLVIMSTVLPASVNKGYHDKKNLILRRVNGIEIGDINHVKEIIDNSGDRFIVLDFIGEQRIILERKQAIASINEIMQRYNIHAPYHLGTPGL